MTCDQGGGLQDDVESKVRPLFQQLILSLAFCHAKGVSNRSITLETILLGRPPPGGAKHPVLKLWDFECALPFGTDAVIACACVYVCLLACMRKHACVRVHVRVRESACELASACEYRVSVCVCMGATS